MSNTILVVEDSSGVAMAITAILKSSNYEVEVAANGKEALNILSKVKPDLILSDIMMPIMDGIEFFQIVRENPEWNQIPFIFLTARGRSDDVRAAKRLGVDDYIVKPFSTEDLLATIEGKLNRMKSLSHITNTEIEVFRNQIMNILSHELRTPLTKIKGYVELIMQKFYSNETQLDTFAKNIMDGGNRIEQIVEDFLKVLKLENSGPNNEQELKAMEANEILRTIQPLLIREANKYKMEIEIVWSEEPLYVLMYDKDIYDCLYHLTSNAVKFSKPGSKVWIRTGLIDNEVFFEVADLGIGIEEKDIPRIFEKFYQINRANYEQQGIGLGLTIVGLATKKNNGKIDVKSILHKGTTIRLLFPRIKNTALNDLASEITQS